MEEKALKTVADECQIRTMHKEELPQVIDILKEKLWPLGLHTPKTWFEIDPNGWMVAVNNSTAEILGIVSVVQLSDDFFYAGNYAVKEKYTGMGIGMKMTNAVMEYIGPRNACMTAESSMFEKYKNKGDFPIIDTDAISVYQTFNKVPIEKLSSEIPEGVNIIPFEESLLEAMQEYDLQFGERGSKRQEAIELSSKENDSKTFVALKDGTCIGFGTIKMSLINILHLGPLYADDEKIAEAILKKLLQSFSHCKGFHMYSFAANKAVHNLMDKIECPKLHEYYHMYKRLDHTLNFKCSMHKLYAHYDVGFLEF